MKSYAGLCAGGPFDSQMYVASKTTMYIVVAAPIKFYDNKVIEYGCGEYKFNRALKMWIWQGTWYPNES